MSDFKAKFDFGCGCASDPLGELTVVWAVKLCTKKILQFLTGGTG